MGHIYFEEEKAQNAKLRRVEKINNEALKKLNSIIKNAQKWPILAFFLAFLQKIP